MTRFEELLEDYFAAGLSAEEEREFAALLAVPENRRMLEEHQTLVRLLGAVRRRPLLPSFTDEVLAQLPERTLGGWERLWNFLWTPRVVRWNAASAIALSVLLIAAPVIWRAWPGSAPAVRQPRQTVTLFRFTLHAPGAERVSVAGDFNGWRTEEVLLSDVTGSGQFSTTLALKPGRYAYMFLIDGTTWVPDPRAEEYRDDGFGNRNAVLTIDAGGASHDQS